MKAIKSLVLAALATAALAATADAQADRGSHFSGGGRFVGGNHFGGFHRFGPRFGVFIGAPLLWSPWYWGYPYDYYYPRTVIYRDVEGYPASYPDGYMEPAPSTEYAPPGPGAPAQGPTYMNYCESAKAYFPKVTTCPEGWKFLPSR
jgi:hypothetical protein